MQKNYLASVTFFCSFCCSQSLLHALSILKSNKCSQVIVTKISKNKNRHNKNSENTRTTFDAVIGVITKILWWPKS